MNERLRLRLLSILMLLYLTAGGCKKNEVVVPVDEPPISIPQGNIQVAAYYFPNWGPAFSSEWALLRTSKPRFNGHQQPKVPMWGYTNENDPVAMAQKIDAAADNGIDAFIFDWYYYDPGSNLLVDQNNNHWDGQKYLSKALEDGFLNATNNSKMKFALMWCNHNLGDGVKGAVAPATFDSIMDYVIEKYFKHPSYWKINGCPYFSIYQINTFLETYGNDYSKAIAAIELFRMKVKAAGFPDLHLNGVLWGLAGDMNNKITRLKLNSTTSYVWIHHNVLPDFPSSDYSKVADTYFKSLENGGAYNGLEAPVKLIPVPYHINVSMGWDSSPRCGNGTDWMTRRDYPFGAVIVNNTPYLFKKYLAKAKALTLAKPENERIMTINSWNEWGEGSYLEPDMINGMKYLEAIKEVFEK
jgi:hypothetical protein